MGSEGEYLLRMCHWLLTNERWEVRESICPGVRAKLRPLGWWLLGVHVAAAILARSFSADKKKKNGEHFFKLKFII